MQLQELREEPLPAATPAGFSLAEVEVRLVRPDERIKWDVLMDQHHYLGFKRFAGRGLRYVAEWRGRWIALAGWQAAALKCGPRDRWIRWRGKKMFKRLHLIANNTRFLVLGERGVFANLGSCMLSAMLRRLSDDWLQQYGHPLLVVESFVDPAGSPVPCTRRRTGATWATARAMRAATVTILTHTGSRNGCTCASCALTRDDPARARRVGRCWQARVPAAVGNEVDKRSLYEELHGHPGAPPRAGPQAFAGDRAGGVPAGDVVQHAWPGGGRRVRAGARPGGTEAAGGVVQPRHRTLRAAHQIGPFTGS